MASKFIIRSVYRTIELANGWSGPIISTERYFGTFCTVLAREYADSALLLIDWLDGGMVTIAICTLNFIHPGVYLKIADTTALASQQAADEEASATSSTTR
jgi:hypothetical protein